MSFQGFINIKDYTNNNNGVIAVFGELSSYSESFSIEHAKFSNPVSYPGLEWVNFRNRGLITKAVTAPPTAAQGDHVLSIAHWVFQEAVQGYNSSDETAFLENLASAQGTVITGYSIGEMITDGNVYFPEWLQWSIIDTDSEGNKIAGQQFKIWFADDSFRRQYSGYDIAFIMPTETADELFGVYNTVTGLLAARTTTVVTAAIAALANKTPYTVLAGNEYDWFDFTDQTKTIPKTGWMTLVWGQAGNNYDVIRDELVEYILANSEHTRADWEVILPDLFISTEFLIVPNWDQYAIANQTMVAGLYSPSVSVSGAAALAKKGMPSYSDEHISSFARYAVNAYKSLGFAICGNPKNRDSICDFYEKFKDYICVNTVGTDFDRISPRTQQWMMLLAAGLKEAEVMTSDSEVPAGFSRLTRNGIIYLAFSYEKVQYLIVTKEGWTAGSITDTTGAGTYLRVTGKWILTLSAEELDAALTGG